MIYKTKGTCASEIEIELDEDHIIQHVVFKGGCSGNLQGITQLVIGQKAEDVIERVSGVKCGFKQTSCPDQLAIALKQAIGQ